MVKQEIYTCKNGVVLMKTYSDAGLKIKQLETGIEYDEAYDIPNRYTYIETNKKITEVEDEDDTRIN